MIRLDGYYMDDPTPYEDGVVNHQIAGFVHDVYRFLDNGIYLRVLKKSELKSADFD